MNPQSGLAVAIGLSVLIYGLATNLGWYGQGKSLSHPATWITKFEKSLWGAWIGRVARFAYYVGLPYLALRQGIASSRMMGLGGWSDSADIPVTIGLAFASFCLLSMAGWSYSRTLPSLSGGSVAQSDLAPGTDWGSALLEVIYLEVHWAFYRSGPIFWLGGNYYTGAFLGFLLISLEWLLNPRIRTALWRPGESATIITRWSLALCMTAAFFFSRSLWLVATLHWLIEAGTLGVRNVVSAARKKE